MDYVTPKGIAALETFRRYRLGEDSNVRPDCRIRSVGRVSGKSEKTDSSKNCQDGNDDDEFGESEGAGRKSTEAERLFYVWHMGMRSGVAPILYDARFGMQMTTKVTSLQPRNT